MSAGTANVKHDGQPVRLTQLRTDPTAAVTVINLGTERVWLSDDSTAPSGHGVPLEGGTPTRWVDTTELYAVADAGNTTDVELVVTDAVESYQPSPYAIAVYAALQIAESNLANATAAALAGETLTVDASGHVVAVDASGHVVPINPGTLPGDTAGAIAATGVPINQGATVLQTVNSALANTYNAPTLDCLGNQTINIALAPTLASDPSGNKWTITLEWLDAPSISANVVTVEATTAFSSSDDALSDSSYRWTVQAKSRFCRVKVTATNIAAEFSLTVLGYTGAISKDTIGRNVLKPSRATNYVLQGSGTIAAGDKATYYGCSVADAITVALSCGSTIPAGKVAVIVSVLDPLIGVLAVGILRNSGSGVVNNSNSNQFDAVQIQVPFGCAIQADLYNNDTANRNPGLVIMDASN